MKTFCNLLLIGSFFCILISSCKKEIVTTENTSSTIVYDENYLTSVKEFTKLMEDISAGKVLKSGQSLRLEDVADKIEAAINFKYCFPDEKISGSKTVDTIIGIVPDSLDYFKFTTVESIYTNVKDIIIYQLKHCGYSNYKLIAIAFEPNVQANQIRLYTVIGNTTLESYPETDYWYGDMLGTCDNQYVFEIDAAEYIQTRLHEYFVSLRPIPPAGCRYVYVGNYVVNINRTQIDQTPDNYLDFDIFYASAAYNNPPTSTIDDIVKCLDYTDEIEFYEANYEALIDDCQTTLKVYASCDVVGKWSYDIIELVEWFSIHHNLSIIMSTRLQECDEIGPINITNNE